MRSLSPGAMDLTDTAVALTLEVVDESGENKVVCGMRGLDASIYSIFLKLITTLSVCIW